MTVSPFLSLCCARRRMKNEERGGWDGRVKAMIAISNDPPDCCRAGCGALATARRRSLTNVLHVSGVRGAYGCFYKYMLSTHSPDSL